jgi:hypothetical protein
MKTVWGRGLFAILILAVISFLLLHKGGPPRQKQQTQSPPAPSAPDASPNPQSNLLAQARSFGVRKAVLTPEERADLAKKFTAKIKPAVEKWCRAYVGHLPFKPDALTLDKFKEQLSRNASFTIYTFMLDGTTLCVQDSNGRVVVNYLNAPQSRQLSQLPGGTVPTMQMPVNRNDVIRMVKEDSGTEFQPSDVHIKPTGAGTAMNGGAFVDIAPRGGDPNNGLCKISLVFGPDGDIAYYMRDPFF